MRSAKPVIALVGLVALSSACEDKPIGKDNNPFAAPSSDIKKPPPLKPTKPSGPPQLVIDDVGAKVGYDRVMLGKPNGADRLDKDLADAKSFFDGKTATLVVDRKAKLEWVVAYFKALAKIGVTGIEVKTETRKEFSAALVFTPQEKLESPKPCTVVAEVLEDRGTAVWRIAGGTATKHRKGFAGPDLTMTADSLEHFGKACADSSTLFVSSSPVIEWGLTYDLAASAQKLEKTKFDTFVLLEETPVAGRKVAL